MAVQITREAQETVRIEPALGDIVYVKVPERFVAQEGKFLVLRVHGGTVCAAYVSPAVSLDRVTWHVVSATDL
jgi:hypothetical protein